MAFTVSRILMVLISIVGTSFLIPIGTAVNCHEYQVLPAFIAPMVVSWIIGIIGFNMGRKKKATLSTRAGFVTVALAWICASIMGAIPLFAANKLGIPGGYQFTFTNAIFESISGFTTTGATILNNIEILPRSINLWRCQTHWLGGMGIVALTVALLPLLGVGGFQLIKAETTGPEKGKLTSKITTTAKILWFMYIGLTAIETVLLKFAGMDLIDAISHAFSTLGTGGFSTRNASIAAYNSVAIDVICTVFMFLAGINFSLYFYLFTGRFRDIKNDTEFKAYVGIVMIAVVAITGIQALQYQDFHKALRYSSFQALSVISTTGFGTMDYTTFHPAAQAIIFLLFFIGGCSGSTSGGVKVIRWVIIGKQMNNEVKKMLHPHGVFSVRINQKVGRKDLVFAVAAFFMIYFILLAIGTLYGAIFGLDLLSAFTGSMSMLGNVGPGFGQFGPANTLWTLKPAIKWFYCFLMLAGRLEFWTMVIFLSPSFWKKN